MEQYEFVLMLYVQQNNAQLRKGHFSNSSQFQVKMRIFFSISFFLFFFPTKLFEILKSNKGRLYSANDNYKVVSAFCISVRIL